MAKISALVSSRPERSGRLSSLLAGTVIGEERFSTGFSVLAFFGGSATSSKSVTLTYRITK